MWDYIAGSNSPKAFHNKPRFVDRMIDRFLVGHGFNGFHLPVIGGRWFDLDATTDRAKPAMTDPDRRTFEALELLITRTHQAGGVANIWGIHPDLGPGGVYPNKDQIKTYSRFFHDKGRFLPDMTPAGKLSADADTRVLLSRRSRSLLLYRQAAREMRVDLTLMPAPQPAVAADTRKAYLEVQLGSLQPKAQTIKLPAVSDWAVAVGGFGQAAKKGKGNEQARMDHGRGEGNLFSEPVSGTRRRSRRSLPATGAMIRVGGQVCSDLPA
jgi:hypothetical protein